MSDENPGSFPIVDLPPEEVIPLLSPDGPLSIEELIAVINERTTNRGVQITAYPGKVTVHFFTTEGLRVRQAATLRLALEEALDATD